MSLAPGPKKEKKKKKNPALPVNLREAAPAVLLPKDGLCQGAAAVGPGVKGLDDGQRAPVGGLRVNGHHAGVHQHKDRRCARGQNGLCELVLRRGQVNGLAVVGLRLYVRVGRDPLLAVRRTAVVELAHL